MEKAGCKFLLAENRHAVKNILHKVHFQQGGFAAPEQRFSCRQPVVCIGRGNRARLVRFAQRGETFVLRRLARDQSGKIDPPRKNAGNYRVPLVRVLRRGKQLHAVFPQLFGLPLHSPEVTFITSQELEDLYPDLTGKERENRFVKEHGTTFLMQIGKKLRSGKPHDGRAPDYDDWELNGDILFWNHPLQCSFELSSMGIRVSPESLDRQLTEAGCEDRRNLPFHKALLAGELPFTIGGGIGQSRLCMLLLDSAHIGEVQASVWDEKTRRACKEAGIPLL